MPLFDREAESSRKKKLKNLEDRRLRLAEKLQADGFAPERMLFCSTVDGRFVAIARHKGQYAVVLSPIFGTDEDFIIEYHDHLRWEREDIFEKGEGLNGMLGLGKKGAKGFIIRIDMQGSADAPLHVVAGRTSWLETKLRQNPLLKTKRRRGDANVAWDLAPLDPTKLSKVEELLMNYYLAE